MVRRLQSYILCFFVFLVPLVSIVGVLTLSSRYGKAAARIASEEHLRTEIMELQERIHRLEGITSERAGQLGAIKSRLIKGYSSNDDMQTSIRLPGLSSFLTTLSDSELIEPAFKKVSSKGARQDMTVVFGLPTVRRKVSYLHNTLRDLIRNLSEEERKQSVFVIMIAETDTNYLRNATGALISEFGEHIETGLIEIISPPASVSWKEQLRQC